MEKGADITLTKRAEHGIANGVHEHVGIGMAVEPGVVRDLHAAEDQRPAGFELMDIVAQAYAIHAGSVGESGARLNISRRALRNGSACRGCDLRAASSAPSSEGGFPMRWPVR